MVVPFTKTDEPEKREDLRGEITSGEAQEKEVAIMQVGKENQLNFSWTCKGEIWD